MPARGTEEGPALMCAVLTCYKPAVTTAAAVGNDDDDHDHDDGDGHPLTLLRSDRAASKRPRQIGKSATCGNEG